MEPAGSASVADEVVCQKATLHSATGKYSQAVKKGSHTHKANHWTFPGPAAARVDYSHQEIAAASEKRAKTKALRAKAKRG